MSALPAYWRVTLTWPKPDYWADPDAPGYVGWKLRHPERLAETFGMQLPKGALEAIGLRARSVRMVAKVPAQPPRQKDRWNTCASSAQIAVEWAMQAAQFGAGVINPRFPDSLNAPLPEPVHITIEAAR